MKFSPIFYKIVDGLLSDKRYIINQGGTYSTKTWSTNQALHILAEKKSKAGGIRIHVTSESFPHLDLGAMGDYFRMLQLEGIYQERNHNKTKHHYNIGDSEIRFFSADQTGKVEGPKRDILYVNEVINVPQAVFDQMDQRTDKKVIVDYNPKWEFWIHEKMQKEWAGNYVFIKSTYAEVLDFIPPDKRAWIERRAQFDPNWAKVYAMGEVGIFEGLKPFVYSFDATKHVSEQAIYNPRNFVYLCLDFNVDPFICLLRHHGINHQAKQRYCHFFGEISLKSASVYEMAEAIKAMIPQNVKNKTIRITGDPTAKSRNLVDKGKRNLYQILLDELDLPLTALDLPPITRNYDNRTLCNAMFFSFPELYIHPDCKQLVYDLRYVQADNYGNKVKANRSDPAQRADALDAMGYSFDKYDWEWIK